MPPARARPALHLLLLATLAAVILTAFIPAAADAVPVRFADPWQVWRDPNGRVALLRPLIAPPTTADAALGALMAPGWQPLANAAMSPEPAAPGRVLLRLLLPTRPADPGRDGPGTELLQLGVGDDPACLSGATASRTINHVRYAVRTVTAAGMNQHLDATELRTLFGGRCYAVVRLRYGVGAGVQDPAPGALPEARAAALLDASLASLRVGEGAAETLTAPRVPLPPGAVAK